MLYKLGILHMFYMEMSLSAFFVKWHIDLCGLFNTKEYIIVSTCVHVCVIKRFVHTHTHM